MKLNDLWRAIIFNWPVKVFSLLLAIGIYLIVNYATLDQRKVEIPLQVINPKGFSASSTVPESVILTIKTDGRYIAMVDPSAITATADFSTVDAEGVFSVPVLLSAQPSIFNIEVSFVTDPQIVKVFFSPVAEDREAEAEPAPGGTPQ